MMNSREIAAAPPRGEAGFSLIELLIAMVVMVEVMAAILLLFTSLSDIASVQTDVAEMQQAHRVGQRAMVEVVREAGLGGLPASVNAPPGNPGVFPDGLAIQVRNNALPDARIGDATSDLLLEGSDVLVVRGVFSTPVYYSAPIDVATELVTGTQILNKTLTLQSDLSGVTQDLQPLEEALVQEPKRLLLVRDLLSTMSGYAVLETNGLAQDIAACGGNCLEIRVTLSDAADSAAYAELMLGNGLVASAGLAVDVAGPLGTVTFPRFINSVGLLDEYRFYLRPDPAFDATNPDENDSIGLTGINASSPTSRLSRASFRPATDALIGTPVDIADNLLDLQVAVGLDRSPDCPPQCSNIARQARGVVTDDGTENDEIQFNHEDDVPIDFTQSVIGVPEFHFIRLTSIVHAERIERGYRAPLLGFVEDSDRSQDLTIAGVTLNYNTNLPNYRRRLLSTVIDLRNVR